MKPSPASITAFYSFLSHSLDDLERSSFTFSPDFMSLRSLKSVLALLRSLHSHLTGLAHRLHLPPADKWLDEYMDDSARLWDACLVLKLGLASLSTFSARADPRRSWREAVGLESENRVLMEARVDTLGLRLDGKMPSDSRLNAFNGFRGALFAARRVSNFLITLLLWGVVCWWPHLCAGDAAAEEESGFAASMARMERRVVGEVARMGGRPGIIMYEFRRAEAAVRKDGETPERIKGWFESMRSGSEDMIEGLDDFFDDIVEGRKKLSDICSSR